MIIYFNINKWHKFPFQEKLTKIPSNKNEFTFKTSIFYLKLKKKKRKGYQKKKNNQHHSD